MVTSFGLNPHELAVAQSDCANTASNISDQLGSLTRYVDELSGSWKGVANSTFQSLMSDYHAHATNLQNTLNSIAEQLGSSHNSYVDTEDDNRRMLTTTVGAGGSGTSLPKPRF